jgi:hypothetical protein
MVSRVVKLTGGVFHTRPTNGHHGTALVPKVQADVANENSFASGLSPVPRHRGFNTLPQHSSRPSGASDHRSPGGDPAGRPAGFRFGTD